MSHQAVNWAIEQRVGGPSAKTVLWSIANYANEDWCSWPSQDTISRESEQSPDTVQRRIRDLETSGFVRRVRLRIAGRRSLNFYILKPSSYFSSSLDDIQPLFPRGYVVDHDAADCGIADIAEPPAKSDVPSPDDTANDAANDTANDAANDAALVRHQEEPSNQGTVEVDVGGDARAGAYSPQAHQLSADLAKVCGHDIQFLPIRWARDGARVAQAWLNATYAVDMMLNEARLIMGRKQDDAPTSINYFDKPFAKAHALRSQPHQVATVNINPNKPKEVSTNDTRNENDDWKSRKDNWRRAADHLRAAAYGPPEPGDAGG